MCYNIVKKESLPLSLSGRLLSFFIFVCFDVGFSCGERIFADRFFHLAISDVGVDLRGVELFVTENIFQNEYVNATFLIHKRSGCVAQFVYRKMSVTKPCTVEVFVDHSLYSLVADAFAKARNKEGVFVFDREAFTQNEPLGQRITASVVQVDDTLFSAFSKHTKRTHFAVNVG